MTSPSKIEPGKLPTMQELVEETSLSLKQNALMVLLNQEPPISWLSYHPNAKIKKMIDGQPKELPLPYLPIERVEFLLSHIFTKWWVEIKDCRVIANSCVVWVRLYVVNPITGETDWQDGIGAQPIQTDKGAGAMDWNAVKNNGVQISAPAAESYAIKDAAEKFGKIFGKDLSRKESVDYDVLIKQVSLQKYFFIEGLIRTCTLGAEELKIIESELQAGITEWRADEMIKRLQANQNDPKSNP